MSTLTMDHIKQAMRLVGAPTPFSGIRIIVSQYATKDSDVRLFPPSKHRSKRIRKKLIKRFGGEFLKQPAIFKTPEAIICHPDYYRRIMSACGHAHPDTSCSGG